FRIKRTTHKQFEVMVKLLERNPELARGMAPHMFLDNEYGLIYHVWLDYKLKLKRKIAENWKEIAATGRGPYTQRSLTPLEQAVDELLSLQQAVNPNGAAFGSTAPAPAYLEEEHTHLEDVEVQPEQAEEIGNVSIRSRQALTNRVKERENLLIKTWEKQAETQESLIGIMKNINSQ
ncbi:uncharacterized protein LOC125779760, partial [Bactrocera dorsalis]|uniref:Uncharacterized protein LOC125779760 n=1 Tax=Bactrocera dorsalis TaxID=27457 RepID=A0ABM3K689_BACDO